MTRLIDADELEKKLPNDLPYKASVKRVLIQAPTVDAEPVRHGKWIKTEWRAICSECGKGGSIFDEPVNPFNYCPHCGAKMED